jgi:hypothetical protein
LCMLLKGFQELLYLRNISIDCLKSFRCNYPASPGNLPYENLNVIDD